MKRLFTLFSVLVTAVVAFGATIEYDFSGSIPSGWTSSATPNGYETSDPARGTQWTTSSTLTLSGVTNVTKVVITCSSNVASKNTIEVVAAGTSWGTETMAKESHVEKTFSGSAVSGNLVINITRAEKSVYIEKIVVTADAADGGDGGDEGDDDPAELDPNYTYAEPTTVSPTGAAGSNAAYSFIQNNIEVKVSTGGQSAGSETASAYFGCNAGNTITFTATKPIQAVVINGYVKKDFSAAAGYGTITYVDASEDAVEADPVVLVKDVESKTITISCDKQMRCYEVQFYFEANPDIEIENGGGGSEEGDYNFDYEPDEATQLDLTYTGASYVDYSDEVGYDYTDILLYNDDYEMEIAVFAPTVKGTMVAPGTYEINSTYAEGTVQASPGGDDYYDYPTYIATGFEYDESYGWYYTQTYYIVSGTMKVESSSKGVKVTIDGATAKGSTVHAVFEGEAETEDEDAIEQTTDNRQRDGKFMRGGQLLIRQGDRVFDVRGIEVK